MASTLAIITRDDTSATSNETPCPTVTQSEEIGVERLERTECMGEIKESEPEVDQVGYEIHESNTSTYSRESVGRDRDVQYNVCGRVTCQRCKNGKREIAQRTK